MSKTVADKIVGKRVKEEEIDKESERDRQEESRKQ